MTSMKCPNCRQPVKPGDDICENCGAVLVAAAGAPPPHQPQAKGKTHAKHAAPTSTGPDICPNCKLAVKPTDDVCENCGAILNHSVAPGSSYYTASVSNAPQVVVSKPVTCPNCGNRLDPNDDICENCGALITASTSSAPVTGQAASTPSTSSPDECPNCHGPRQSSDRFCRRCGFNYTAVGANQLNASGTPAPTITRLSMGSILNNKYKITKAIGAGGMGAVYLAEDTVLKRPVVIKALLTSDDPELVAQSVKEREFLAAIKHSNIVSIYDFFTIDTEGYIVMEYVEGKTIHQIMEDQGGPLSVSDAISYIINILPAFTYLAKLNLVYCDFKPQNVMLEILKDGTKVIKLIDLGTVIKWTPDPDAVYGTEGFYAPEAVKAPSPETDLYSICRALAWMVSWMDLDRPQFGMPPAEYYKAFRDYPVLYRLLTRGTNANPARRFHSAEELGDQLAGVLRLIVGGTAGVPVSSRLFTSGALTTTGKLGPRAESSLDENDKAIDYLRQGDQALRSGNYTSAVGFYNQAAGVNPNSLDAHLRLAEIYIDNGEFSQALAEVTRAQRTAPGNWKVVWYNGRLLEAQGKFQEAAEQYTELMNELPGELPPQQALARVRSRMNDDQGSVVLYQNVLKADPGNTEAILGMTNSLMNLQRWDEAVKVLGNVSEATSKYVDAQLMLCDLFLYRIQPINPHNIERASQALNALTGRTQDARYYLTRGDVYRMAKKLAMDGKLGKTSIAGVPNTLPRTLGEAAEKNYIEYLRREPNAPDREEIIRKRFAVAPWRLI